MKTAIYIRVSTNLHVKEGYSIDEQKEKLLEYAKFKGLEIARLYIDEGVSGKSVEARDQLLQLLEDAKNKLFEFVLIYKLIRLGRNSKVLLEIEETFRLNGVSLISFSKDVNTNTPTGKLLFTMLGGIAEMERSTISTRMQLGKEQKVREGKVVQKTTNRVYGYDYKEDADENILMVVNPQESYGYS